MTEKETKTNELTPEQKIEDLQKESASLPPEKKQVKQDLIVRDTVERVCASIDDKIARGEFTPCDGFDWKNAAVGMGIILKTAKDKNGKPVLEVCTPISIYNTVYESAVKGLAAVRKQCYPVAYGNELTLVVSYFGLRAQVLRIPQVIDCNATLIYEGDEFSYAIEDAVITGVKHVQVFDNLNREKIRGAYATIVYRDGSGRIVRNTTVMTAADLEIVRSKSPNKNGSVYSDYLERMYRKIVFKRACNDFIQSAPFDIPRDLIETLATDSETGETVKIDQSKVVSVPNPDHQETGIEVKNPAEPSGRPW